MHSIDLIMTLTGGLAGALIFGYLTQRVGLSPIVGYLLAGVAVGPNTPGFVADTHLAEQLAEVGVILLMFGVGLQFHVEELLAVKWIAVPGAIAQSAAATALGALVDNVTNGDGVAVVDHPLARFVAGHRTSELTFVMRAASAAGGPFGMVVLTLATGLLLGIVWRSWAPAAVLGTTAAGTIGLTIVFKAALAQPRPPLAQAVAAADGYGFPSGHAAAAAAVCGAAAWLCNARMRSWRARTGIWAAAAVLTALVGISRVYLGVHWATDVIGGWIFGLLWLAVVVSAWAAFAQFQRQRARQAPPSPRRPGW